LKRAEEILTRLLDHYERQWRPRTGDPFRSLVRIILSQNTNYRNEATAYTRLEEIVGVTPRSLTEAPVDEIAEAIRPAGMYRQRSMRLKQVARAVIDRYNGDINEVINRSYPEAREELMTLPGVGEKTADVLLLFDAGKEIIPVDRHIFRITKRLGIVCNNAKYDEVRTALEDAAPPGRHEDIHVLLIQFGRDLCRARRPRCRECFLSDLCPYPNGEQKTINKKTSLKG
jgi:endonuclease-3